MKLSCSNIAWGAENDAEMYAFLKEHGFYGLEIAPTRIFPENPYEHVHEAEVFRNYLHNEYGLSVPSMQSIWYGRTENIFASDEERSALIEYTKKAILFAKAVDCGNLVFGCPKNRNIPSEDLRYIALDFFNEIGTFATEHGTVIAIEPNPPIYNTNFINTTKEAYDICRKINNNGIRVNVDTGTIIANNESIDLIAENIDMVNHIHISEPMLVPLEKRELHKELARLKYDNWISIEIKNSGNLDDIKKAVGYIREVMV
ncbi:MAG: sugar phosphate isomerase/epimerase family protein [Eubacteriales bacterium]